MSTLDPHPRPGRRIAARLALLAAAIALFGFLAGFAGRWWWLADLLSHFRIQYLLVLVASGAVLFALQWRRSAFVVSAAALAVSVSVLGYIGWPLQQARATAADFRFVTFNQHFGNRNAREIGRYLEEIRADVVTLQEVPSREAVEKLAAHLPSYPHVYTEAPFPYGAVILSRWPIVDAQTIRLVPQGARAAKVTIDWQGQKLSVVGVHLRWQMGRRNSRFRDSEMQALAELAKATEGPLLIGGDMNVSPWSPVFAGTFAGSSVRDCAEGLGVTNTWPSVFPMLGIRIDQCLASDHWTVVGIGRGPALGSDHLPTVTDLQLAAAQ